MTKRLLAAALFPMALAAQPAPVPAQILIVNASRTVTLLAEEAIFEVTVNTGETGAELPLVLKLLDPVGVKAEDLLSVSNGVFFTSQIVPLSRLSGPRVVDSSSASNGLEYRFVFTRPAAEGKQTLDRLNVIPGVTHRSYLSASARQIEQARSSVLRELVEETRRKADALTKASGFTLGPIEQLSENVTGLRGVLTPYSVVGTQIEFTVTAQYNRQQVAR